MANVMRKQAVENNILRVVLLFGSAIFVSIIISLMYSPYKSHALVGEVVDRTVVPILQQLRGTEKNQDSKPAEEKTSSQTVNSSQPQEAQVEEEQGYQGQTIAVLPTDSFDQLVVSKLDEVKTQQPAILYHSIAVESLKPASDISSQQTAVLQPSSQGWIVFGVPWYLWAIGVSAFWLGLREIRNRVIITRANNWEI